MEGAGQGAEQEDAVTGSSGPSGPPGASIAPRYVGTINKGGRKPDPVREHYTIPEGATKDQGCKRYAVRCRYCGLVIPASSAKPTVLRVHLLDRCTETPAAVRAALVADGASTATSRGAQAGNKPPANKRPRQAANTAALAPKAVQEVHQQMLRWVVDGDLPFQALDDPHLRAALSLLHPCYDLPSAEAFRTQLLPQEYAACAAELVNTLKAVHNVTLAFRRWVDPLQRAVLGVLALLPDRRCYLLEVVELSEDELTAQVITEALKGVLTGYALVQKTVALVCDSSSMHQEACQLLVEAPGFRHILTVRCAFHNCGDLLGAVLSHPWARDVVTRCQDLVLHLHYSPRPLAALHAAAGEAGITLDLRPATKGSMASVERCVSSVNAAAPAFDRLVRSWGVQPGGVAGLIPDRQVLGTVQDRAFWSGLQALCGLVQPLSKGVQGIQSRVATLADVARYLGFFGRSLKSSLPALPLDYQAHVVAAFSQHMEQVDPMLLRLALYLDPRYRGAAMGTPAATTTTSSSSRGGNANRGPATGMPSTHTSSSIRGRHANSRASSSSSSSRVLDLQRQLTVKASQLGHARGYTEQQGVQLCEELYQYGAGEPPYDRPLGDGGFDCRDWWRTVGVSEGRAEVLPKLAVILCDVVPHDAAAEGVLSSCKWFPSSSHVPSGPSLGTSSMRAAIKMHLRSAAADAAATAGGGSSSGGGGGGAGPSSSRGAGPNAAPGGLMAGGLGGAAGPAMPQAAAAGGGGGAEEEAEVPGAAELEAELTRIAAARGSLLNVLPTGCTTWADAVQVTMGPLQDLAAVDLTCPHYKETLQQQQQRAELSLADPTPSYDPDRVALATFERLQQQRVQQQQALLAAQR